MLGRTDTDLRAFAAAGGKLILAQGWTDPIVSPYNTIDYFTKMQAKMGAASVDGFSRLFMAPGVDHCGGGSGPDHFDALTALQRWVEMGEAPAQLIATKMSAGGEPTQARPLCPYPHVARYDGAGDPTSAESFSCKDP
jgi:feruloyl esterase